MPRRLTLLILIGLILLPGCQADRSAPQARDYQTLPDATDRQVEQARELHEQALLLIEQGELDAAEPLLKEALAADPMFGPAHNSLGRVYFEQGKFYPAAWEFEYAIKTMPNHPEPKNNLGLVLETARKLDEAIEYYRQAYELEPDNAEILGNLLRARLGRGDRGEDVRELLRELMLKDTRPQWLSWAREQHAMLAGR